MKPVVSALSCGAALNIASWVLAGATIAGSGFVLEVKMQPSGPGLTAVLGEEDGTSHRVFVDKDRSLYYGYDIKVTRSETPPGFLIVLGPLSARGVEKLNKDLWSQVCPGCPPPSSVSSRPQRYPPPQVLRLGDRITVDLLADERTGNTVSDEIVLLPPQTAPESRPPQDFAIDKVELQVIKPRFLVDGQAVSDDGGAVSGESVWLSLPKQGRVFFSLFPIPGYPFRKTGVVEGNKIRFDLGGHHYEWVSEGAIVTPVAAPPFFLTPQSWNLWILHDVGYASSRPGSYGGGFDRDGLRELKGSK